MRRELLYPIAGMFVAPVIKRIIVGPIVPRLYAVGGDKRRGIDSFKMAVKLKNIGNVDIDNWEYILEAVTKDRKWGITIKSGTFDLAVGEEKRFPSSGYYEIKVPSNAPTGLYDARVTILDENGNVVDVPNNIKSDAWNVIEAKPEIKITDIEVS